MSLISRVTLFVQPFGRPLPALGGFGRSFGAVTGCFLLETGAVRDVFATPRQNRRVARMCHAIDSTYFTRTAE